MTVHFQHNKSDSFFWNCINKCSHRQSHFHLWNVLPSYHLQQALFELQPPSPRGGEIAVLRIIATSSDELHSCDYRGGKHQLQNLFHNSGFTQVFIWLTTINLLYCRLQSQSADATSWLPVVLRTTLRWPRILYRNLSARLRSSRSWPQGSP